MFRSDSRYTYSFLQIQRRTVKIVLILLLFSVSLGHAQVLELECQSAVGVVGENTKITCSFKFPPGFEDATINEVKITKKGQTDPVLYINFLDPAVNEGLRIQLHSRTDPSLLFTNTAVSDEGEYEYGLDTNRGVIRDGVFSLSVTAKYDSPVINSVPEEIKVGDGAELYCSTSGGYPAGGIHWFDSTGANWTERATLKITKRDDRLLTMSSKLTLTVTGLSLEPFRCVVLNSSFSEVGETSFRQRTIGGPHSSPHPALVVALVLVPVLILILIIIWCRRRRKRAPREPAAGGGADVDGTVTPLKKE
ncbi:zwei Ig domain protein zig-1-like isoform X2 [Hoplias malabaricus]|uniref:zwei Ig domain protein zig-1-like isoform X2 n=1 Tax=Hoplias malabaricus TaxID=27720 RepID=UPI0034619B86